MEKITTVGIDLAKNVFSLHGVDAHGKVALKRYIYFHDKRHPEEMGAAEVTAFLTALAVERTVAAATQNQALAALLFLYKQVLGHDLPWLDEMVRTKRPVRLPVVLTADETRRLLSQMNGTLWIMAGLLYGAGLRLRQWP